ncbi:MAG: trigger factor [Planctomycetota bacterium]|jgi:trigger factor|nr:trigger factor [Planctomycetota bacterium]
MKHELRDGGQPCRKQLFLHFEPDEVNLAIDEAYRDINKMVRLPGFRHGKAPRRMLEKRFGAEVADGARQWFIDKHLVKLIKDEKLRVMGPLVDKRRDAKPAAGEPYTMELELELEPEFQLPDYVGLELEDRPVSISEEAVDAEVDRSRRMLASVDPTDEPADLEDILLVDFEARVDGGELKSMKDQRLRVGGERLFDLSCPPLIEKLKGARPGDQVHFSLALPDDYPIPEMRGRPVEVEVMVKAVERPLFPDIPGFMEKLGYPGGVEGFRNTLRQRLTEKAMDAARSLREDEIIGKLLGAVEYPAPPDLIRGKAEEILDQYRRHLTGQGYPPGEALEAEVEKKRREAAETALKALRWEIMLRRIAEKENIAVSDADMAAQIESLASSYGTSPQRIAQRIRKLGGGEAMRNELLSLKVVHFIAEKAKGGNIAPSILPPDFAGQLNAEAAQSVNASAEDGEPAPAAGEGGGTIGESGGTAGEENVTIGESGARTDPV